jgi:hypothetical protein
MMLPTSSRSGKKTSIGHAGLDDLVQLVGGELLVGLVQQLAGGHVDHVGRGHRAVELAGLNLNRLDLVRAQVA